MSCKCNGAPMREGRHNYAMMPATIIVDNRHPVDTRPLTREQILAMPGVSMLPVRKPAALTARLATQRLQTTNHERAEMVRMYQERFQVKQIAEHFGRERSTVREIPIRSGIYRLSYKSRIRGEHLAKKQEGAAK